MPEAGVVEVAVGGVRACPLRDESAEPLAHAQPQFLEACGDRAVGDAHVGVPGGRVVEGEVRGVGAQQGAGAPHDGLEHRVDVAQPRQVVRGGEEGRQFGLASSAVLQFGSYAQREELGPLHGGEPLRSRSVGADAQDGLFVRLGGRTGGEQREIGGEGAVGVVVGHGDSLAVGRWVVHQRAVHPPSMVSVVPVMKEACGPHR
ncbi:hypothetical protein GCM10020000_03970 [Streptomyces olivoverticillatus]